MSLKNTLILFLDQIRAYERESRNMVGFDERETEEFVDIFINTTYNGTSLISNKSLNGFTVKIFPTVTQERGSATLLVNPSDLPKSKEDDNDKKNE